MLSNKGKTEPHLYQKMNHFFGALGCGITLLGICGCANQPTITTQPPGAASIAVAPNPALSAADSQQYTAATSLLKQNSANKALPLLQQLHQSNPKHTGIIINLANTLFILDKFPDAKNILATNAAAQQSPAGLNLQGLLAVGQGNFIQAEKFYLAAKASANPPNEVFYNLGLLYDIYLQNPAKAIDNYQIFLAKNGDDKTLSQWLAELKRKQKL